MTSTRSDLPEVYLEFPDFGFGPASTLLSLLRPVARHYDLHIVSTGAAAEHVFAELPEATLHDLDTFHSEGWGAFEAIAPPGARVVSVTNPQFAAWAVGRGYCVGVVDTLDWMWGHDPTLDGARFHLVQCPLVGVPTPPSGRREYVRPIVDASLWSPETVLAPVPGDVVVGFGGMGLPGANDLVAQYTRWFLGAALPLLIELVPYAAVTVAGGREDLVNLVPGDWAAHPAVRVRPGLTQAEYARVVQRAEHLLCSPGLASIHECATAGLTPLWQPGFNMSMLLQMQQLADTRYEHLVVWPWMTEVAEYIEGMPEEEGVRHLAERIEYTIRSEDPDGELVAARVARYLRRLDRRDSFRVAVDNSLPDAAPLFATHLGMMS